MIGVVLTAGFAYHQAANNNKRRDACLVICGT
jgi:hypothetical protein